jgi:hypothetical protein
MNRRLKCQSSWSQLSSLLILFIVLQLSTSSFNAANQTGRETAEMILHNGSIWTVDPAKPTAEAIALGGGKIIKVGSNADCLALKGERSQGWIRSSRLQR